MAHQIWLNKKRSLGSRNTTKYHTQKKPRNTTKCNNIFAIFFISNCGRSQFDIIILFFTFTIFLQQIFGEKLLLVLKLCIKKTKKTKRQHKKIVCEIVIFGSPNLTILKKKSKNTTKYHNIFTIHSFLGFELIFFYLIWEKCYIHNIFRTNSKWQVVIGFKLSLLLISLFYLSKIPCHIKFVVKLLWKMLWT